MENVIGTVVDLLLFYTLERYLFNRLVTGGSGKDPKVTKMVIALWLWLEEIGHYDLIRTIFSYADSTIETLYNETILCLDYISPNSALPTNPDDTPFLARLLNEPINSRFFHYNRNFIASQIANTMDRVCNVIFGENAAREVNEDHLQYGEGTSTQGYPVEAAVVPSIVTKVTDEASSSTSVPAALNPLARPYAPRVEPTPDAPRVRPTPHDQRSMFLTFSRGHPLTREEIYNFFTSRWGQVVEDVLIERAPTGAAPLYGRIVFTSAAVIPIILNGQRKAKFEVNRRHLWARQYVSKERA